MISCIVIDDEPHAIDLLKLHIGKVPLLDLQFATTNSIEAFQYVQQHRTDLIFLDIHMPELDGIQFLKLLGSKSKVILTTAYSEYALEGYEHNIIDYLLKPIRFERFLSAAQKAIAVLTVPQPIPSVRTNDQGQEDDFIFVKTETRNKIVQIQLSDIQYIEGLGNYVSFYTTSSRIVTLSTMKELEDKLPANKFIRIHHSYVVPISKITQVEGNQLWIGTQKLPIGETYRKAFLSAIDTKILNNRK